MIRAKFTCQQNTLDHETQTATVVFTPVTNDPPSEENLTFWRYTPAGNITLQITNPLASAQFSVGTAYYVDFTAA
ncbi:hypothetical protein [Nostoc sp. 'Lobaria pulmonaria (5183) cyanobiont']|uniref:hypothetical protein n=1 Tax=Nostoc sp. 'Lobaria pulmonaria (5183) cyanobiont' TaxID=1618022 RepID=UPI000CF35CBF|nr:hypothetical protein [Nostoc sp. 'Lobaria pulmonaria (5183) cyanobiont']AVH71578.1 hypothetical protein NLP_2987 [Nostoc sp. 'Lobaria pulmonaria (5183) cyanobiont']